MRKALCHERKAFAGRYYKLLSGHTAIGSCLCDKIKKLPVKQVLVVWRDVEKLCGWNYPRALTVVLLLMGHKSGAVFFTTRRLGRW